MESSCQFRSSPADTSVASALGAGSTRTIVVRRALRELVAWAISRCKRPPRGRAGRKATFWRSSGWRREASSRGPARASTANSRRRSPSSPRKECAPEALRQAEAAARRDGVSAEQALLGEGLIGEEAYYRALARRLRLPFYRGEIPVARSVEADPAIACGVAPLAPNRAGLRVIAAPRAMAIRYLLDRADAGASALRPVDRLAAHVERQACAPKLARHRRGRGETRWRRRDPALCARFGVSRGQCVALASSARSSRWPLRRSRRKASPWSCRPSCGRCSPRRSCCAIWRSPHPPSQRPREPLDESELPIYTIIAPLRGEARMVAKLVRRLDALDYPRGKLDIKLVVERDDDATRAALGVARPAGALRDRRRSAGPAGDQAARAQCRASGGARRAGRRL